VKDDPLAPIFYAQGVKANVLFFDKKPAAERRWTERLWIYDLRTNQHFTLKQNTLTRAHLDEFVASYVPGKPRSERVETERFHSFAYDELVARDKANLDITWLRDESLEDLDNLPAPEVIAREIVEDLTAALAEFEAVAAALEAAAAGAPSNDRTTKNRPATPCGCTRSLRRTGATSDTKRCRVAHVRTGGPSAALRRGHRPTEPHAHDAAARRPWAGDPDVEAVGGPALRGAIPPRSYDGNDLVHPTRHFASDELHGRSRADHRSVRVTCPTAAADQPGCP
jgi:N-6 DNA Methylase